MINFKEFLQLSEANASELLAKHRMGIKEPIQFQRELKCYICNKELDHASAHYIANKSKKRIETPNIVKYVKLKHFLNSPFCSDCINKALDFTRNL
jgi:hypothetical protein